MRIDDDWLRHPATQAVMGLLTEAGHQALAVGGCVRNALLGAPVSDIDIATDARPDRVLALAEAAQMRAIPTGLDHGTITLVVDGLPHEVTTFRRDVETDGRHAKVAFSDDPATDAARRDFTMNALYADRHGQVVDPLGGLADLQAGHVRFIGDPAARITEDYLRILRFFRFTAWYGDPALGLDAEGLAACAEHQDGLDQLSRERVGHELRKLLAAPNPAPEVAGMAQAGILARILPGSDPTPLAPLIHLGDTDWIARLAALGGDAGHLRLSKQEAKTLHDLATAARDGTDPFTLGDELGPRARDVLLIRAALLGEPIAPGAVEEARKGADETFPLTAADLMPDLQGPALGQALAKARTIWRRHKGAIDKQALIQAAKA
ncbi:MAG: CCA tRNA nucleotidyltransferase [Pseudomonadota bacterium]